MPYSCATAFSAQTVPRPLVAVCHLSVLPPRLTLSSLPSMLGSTTAVALEQHPQSAFTTIFPNPSSSIFSTPRSVAPSEPALVLAVSNVRERSLSPRSSPEPESHIPFYVKSQRILELDARYALPPPDRSARFTLKNDEPIMEDGTSLPESDVQDDTPNRLPTPLYDPSIPLPRIYFADSALQFVPPFCHDYLDRDPLIKGVPRNYRAWARTGRPKLEIEGLERVDAKKDFFAMGLTYPQGSDDEDSSDDKEKSKKGKRKKKPTAKAQIVPIERPRRTVRKVFEAEPLAVITTQKKRAPEKKVEEKPAPPPVPVPPAHPKPTLIEPPKPVLPYDDTDDMDIDAVGETDSEAELELSYPAILVPPTILPPPPPPPPLSMAPPTQPFPPPPLTAQAVQAESPSKRKRAEHDKEDLISAPAISTKRARTSERLVQRQQRESAQDASQKPCLPPSALVLSASAATPAEKVEDENLVLQLQIPQPPRPTRRPTAASVSPSISTPAPAVNHSVPRTRPAPRQTQPRAIASASTTGVASATGSNVQAQLPPSRPGHRVALPAYIPRQAVPSRSFPPSTPIVPGYSGFYRRFPLITQFDKDDPLAAYILNGDVQPKRPLGNWNAPRDVRDLYTPRYTKGSGGKKIALCPICYEETSRGGEGRQEWNHTKTSQHNYHMQYYHGISASRFQPFSPPVAHRTIPVARPQSNEKAEILQGKCHNCKLWIPLEGCKVGELKVKELFWWKHAATCHKDSFLTGETDVFIEDDAYRRLVEYESRETTNGQV